MTFLINDIDGEAVQTVATGDESAVRSAYSPDHPVQDLISQAIVNGSATATYDWGRETYTTCVVAE